MSNWHSGPPDFSFDANLATVRQESENLLLLLQESQTLNKQIKARCRADKTTLGPFVTHRNERYWPEFLYDMESLAIPNIAALILAADTFRFHVRELLNEYPIAKHHSVVLRMGLQGFMVQKVARFSRGRYESAAKTCRKQIAKRERKKKI